MIDELDDSAFTAEWEHWHEDHEVRRARPHGFLAITDIHWLGAEPQRFADVPGEWSSGLNDVRVLLGDGEELLVDDDRVVGDYRFHDVDESGVTARFADAIVEVARRDGNFMIRPRHPDHVVRADYRGTPTYPPSAEWVITGTLRPSDAPRAVTVAATVEGLSHVYESPGEVEFELEGQVQRLVAFNGEDPDELFIVFTDLTASQTTYGACRFLTVKTPGPDGRVVLDFNRATNPPCAYTDFATCPLPPPTNHLPVRVEAGEQLPSMSH
ncbi:MAG TPA: DUF1684 domain-containing protein [Acidimicrobiales bacterium]|nr:DUF1684 domain-containing protein [Acidimicrobiales bacterium]